MATFSAVNLNPYRPCLPILYLSLLPKLPSKATTNLGAIQPDEEGPGDPCPEHGHRPAQATQGMHPSHGSSSQYCSHDYQKILRKHGLTTSMSGKGNCYDNAAVESFFKSLKAEMVWRRNWQTRGEVEVALFKYINGFYNPRRRHSALGWKSPVAFERKAT